MTSKPADDDPTFHTARIVSQVDDRAIEETIARYSNPIIFSRAFDRGDTNTQYPDPAISSEAHFRATSSPKTVDNASRGKQLLEEATLASIAQLSNKLMTNEHVLIETVNSRCPMHSHRKIIFS
jgi:hypothetical protein